MSIQISKIRFRFIPVIVAEPVWVVDCKMYIDYYCRCVYVVYNKKRIFQSWPPKRSVGKLLMIISLLFNFVRSSKIVRVVFFQSLKLIPSALIFQLDTLFLEPEEELKGGIREKKAK